MMPLVAKITDQSKTLQTEVRVNKIQFRFVDISFRLLI